jgi:hypothetical protein
LGAGWRRAAAAAEPGRVSPEELACLLRLSCLAWRFTNDDLADACADPATPRSWSRVSELAVRSNRQGRQVPKSFLVSCASTSEYGLPW